MLNLPNMTDTTAINVHFKNLYIFWVSTRIAATRVRLKQTTFATSGAGGGGGVFISVARD